MTSILILCREDNLTWVNAGYARALRRAGVRLHCVPWGTPFNANLNRLAEQCPERPDYIFHFETDFPLLPRGLASLDIPTAIFHSDAYAFPHRRVRWSMLFDHVFLLHPGFEEPYRNAGHPRPLSLAHAAERDLFDASEETRFYEVGWVGRMVGAPYQSRSRIVNALARHFRMNDWQRFVSPEEMALVYRRSKIVVNVGRDDYPQDANLRVFEAMAAGALLVTALPSELTRIGFQEGVHFVGYHKEEEIIERVRHFLIDEGARQCIAEAGREKVLRQHTYDCRVKTVLESLKQDGGRLHAPARRWPEARVHLAYLDFFSAQRCLEHAWLEWRKIAGGGLREAAAGAALLLRAWTRWPRRQLNADAPHSS